MLNSGSLPARPREGRDPGARNAVARLASPDSRVRRNERMGRCLALMLLALPCCSPASAQSVADFYKGKSVNLAISFPPGGGYDLYARILGRHMGKHIPGNPNIV